MTLRCRSIGYGAGAMIVRAAALVAVAASLSGCYTAAREPVVEAVPIDYRQRHPITLQEGDRTVEVFVGTSRGGLSAAQRADVLGFSHAWNREATGGIIIQVPSGTPNARAAADTLREIRSILAAAGVPGSAVVVRPYRPADPTRLATIKLNYPKITAEAGPCGLWPEDIGPSTAKGYWENRPYWNLGCASQRNLAAMVDNPSDLVQPRAETPVYTARRTVVLDKYRKGESTSAVDPNAGKGKISDIGK
jgi:pilus assembly protein CpaD